MPSILLIRHGQASFGTADYDVLSPRGITQSERVADELSRRIAGVDMVASGSLVRQRATAGPVAAALGLEVTVDPRWNEYDMDEILARHSDSPIRMSGHSPGQPAPVSSRRFQDLLEQAVTRWIDAGTQSPAAETWPQFQARTREALGDIAGRAQPGSTALAFTSGGVLAAICCTLLELDGAGFVRLNRVAVNAAITRIAYGRRGATLISFNEHGHLEHPDRSLISYR